MWGRKFARKNPWDVAWTLAWVFNGGLKWTSDFKRNYGVYIGKTDANKKTSRKVRSKFENV